jgi:hypothetical protein
MDDTDTVRGSAAQMEGGLPAPAKTAGRLAAEEIAAKEPDSNGKVVVEEQTAADATEWLLASFRDELPALTHTLELNVGSPSAPKMIKWRITSVDREVIDKLTDQVMPTNRAMKRAGGASAKEQADAQWRLNLKLVVAGTIDPDIRGALTQTAPGPGQPHLADPEFFVERAFRMNSGLVQQVASAILTLSGYDEDNVSDVVEGAAAGNS